MWVGPRVGWLVGLRVGAVGLRVGARVGALLGGGVGAAVTGAVGDGVGVLLGCAVAGRHGSHVQFLPLQVFWTFGTAYRDALHWPAALCVPHTHIRGIVFLVGCFLVNE